MADEGSVMTISLLNQYINVQTLLLFSILLALLISHSLKISKKSLDLAPGPKGWPLFGNLLSLNFHSERVMSDWNKQYGPVCRLKMGNKDFIILGSFEAMQEAFVKKGDVFSDRMQNTISPFSGNKGIVFINYNNKLKEQRRFCLTTLREFGMGRRSIEPSILERCSHLCERIDEHCEKGEPFDIDIMVYETVSSVISQLVFNRNLPAENEEFRKYLLKLVAGDEYTVYLGIAVFFPALKAIPPFSYGNQSAIQFEKTILRIIRDQVNDHKITRDRKDPRDLIDCFLNEMDTISRRSSESEDNGSVKIDTSFEEGQLAALVRDLFLAGSETSSTTCCWLLLYVTLYPEIQEKMHQEIEEILGERTQPSMSNSDQLPYTRAVIQETLRIRPVAPTGVPHVAASSETVLGYRIPKGATVVSNIFGIHHDEKVWPDPEKFDPDRHLDGEGKFVKSPHVIAFSSGPRQCLGQQLAIMELFLIVVTLFQHYFFRLIDKDNVDVKGKNIFSLRPYPYKVVASRR